MKAQSSKMDWQRLDRQTLPQCSTTITLRHFPLTSSLNHLCLSLLCLECSVSCASTINNLSHPLERHSEEGCYCVLNQPGLLQPSRHNQSLSRDHIPWTVFISLVLIQVVLKLGCPKLRGGTASVISEPPKLLSHLLFHEWRQGKDSTWESAFALFLMNKSRYSSLQHNKINIYSYLHPRDFFTNGLNSGI